MPSPCSVYTCKRRGRHPTLVSGASVTFKLRLCVEHRDKATTWSYQATELAIGALEYVAALDLPRLSDRVHQHIMAIDRIRLVGEQMTRATLWR